MEVIERGSWVFYVDPSYEDLDPDRTGKWLVPFDDIDIMAEACEDAVEGGVVSEAKHSATPDASEHGGICCLYLHGDDEEGHEEVIAFLLGRGLVPRDGSGRLIDIPFKYDWQTRAGLYDDDFVPELTLGDLVDLGTGEWL